MNKAIEQLRKVKKLAGTIGGLSLDGGSATQLLADWDELEKRNEDLERINKEWQQVVQPAFDYVDSCGNGELGKSKIGALIESHKALAAHVEQIQEIIGDGGKGGLGDWFARLRKVALQQSPQASLAEVRAVSAFDSIQKCNHEKAIAVIIDDKPVSVVTCKDMAAFAYDYANKIRNCKDGE